jgi:hypothetical protein
MENVVRTIYSANIQTCQFTKAPLVIEAYTTLNQKLNFQSAVSIPDGVYPSLEYFAVGNGGHSMSVGVGGIPTPGYVPHYPTDSGLYSQLPFVLRLPSNDLTLAQQASYRGRAMITAPNNIQYVAYYLKTLVPATTPATPVSTPSVQTRTLANGVTTSAQFVPTQSNLTPTPPTLAQQQAVATSGNYVSVSALYQLTLSLFDITELINVSTILYGSPNYAIISEVALCTGYDMPVSGTFGTANPVTYVEAIGAQIAVHSNDFKLLSGTTTSVSFNIDVGASTPMLLLQ